MILGNADFVMEFQTEAPEASSFYGIEAGPPFYSKLAFIAFMSSMYL